jgi:Acyl-coenzyme A:6-aminopenicillanic acid acyl-transferase
MTPVRKRLLVLFPLAGIAIGVLLALQCSRSYRDRPGESSASRPAGVVRLSGTPEQIGRQHGEQLSAEIRTVIREYVAGDVENGRLRREMLARVRVMKPSLPDWYRRELAACARAAKVDEDVLLYAQCEGDIKGLGGCTTYVAYGGATADGSMEIGRNFDYWGLDSTERCAKVFAVIPERRDGYAFVSVGWAGILGGWTFYNEKGLFVANNLGGFSETNPRGIPTLIMERIIAQKAATLAEAIALIRKNPRMRGQALIIGQAGDAARGLAPAAAVVEYDGTRVEVTQAAGGFAFHSSAGTDPERLKRMLKRAKRKPAAAIYAAGTSITLHSVAIRPAEGKLWVAHGKPSRAHTGTYLEYLLPELLKRATK